MFFLGSKEKKFKMIWKIEAGGKTNYLGGTAHFFPYTFKTSLTELIGKAETVLLEGPLDERNMDLVRQYALDEKESQSFCEMLDRDTIRKINEELEGGRPNVDSSLFMYVGMFEHRKNSELHPEINGLKPWMAFFKVWMHYLRKRGWKYSVDMEAFEAAKQLGKNLYFLETIEEQIHALEGIPVEKIANFLKKMDIWEQYAKKHSKHYLAGDYDALRDIITEYPTRCESIIDKRDPVMFERMKPYLEKGSTIVFVGTSHIRGIKKMLEESGYTISKYER